MDPLTWFAGLSLLITFAILIGQSLYKIGQLSARVDALDAWRINVRNDFHEVSDKLDAMALMIKGMSTLIDERTERRKLLRQSGD